tara:strand:- start:5494 stop:6291 length:798 start_codon:yes stop_codon:yes gene_type:complete
MEKLSYEPYNKTKLAIRGPGQFDSLIKSIGGRWNSRMKGGPGWTIDNAKEEQIKTLIDNLNGPINIENNSESESDGEGDNGIISGVTEPEMTNMRQENEILNKPKPQPQQTPDYEEMFRQQREQDMYRQMPREMPREMPRDVYDNRRPEPMDDFRRRPTDRYWGQQDYRDGAYRDFERGVSNNYKMNDQVDKYYSKFNEKTRMRKNNNKQTRQELSESESEDDYDSDELNSLVQTLNQLNEKVGKIKDKKDKSRGRKHRKRNERR